MSDQALFYKRPGAFTAVAALMVAATVVLLSAARHPALAQECRIQFQPVAKVIDGDTVLLSNGRLVRYIGIDAPEIDHRAGLAEAYGFEALRFNRHLIQNRRIGLQFDRQRYDRYGRLLAYAFTAAGAMINELILKKGLARVFYHRQNSRYHQRLLQAQRQAMSAGAGIWKFWSEPGRGPYVGNRRSFRFHLPGCPMAKRVTKNNRILLPTAWKAYYLGFSPCRVCQPPGVDPFSSEGSHQKHSRRKGW